MPAKSSAPRVLLVARTLPWHIPGGLERHAWEVARALRRHGAEVHCYTTAFDGVRRVEHREGVRIVALPHLPKHHDRRPFWRWWGRFAGACRREFEGDGLAYDLILSEMLHAHDVFLSPRAASAFKIYVMHGSTAQDYALSGRAQLRSRFPSWHPRAIGQVLVTAALVRRQRRWLPRADVVVAPSEFVAGHLRRHYGVPAAKIRLVGNGVDVPRRIPGQAEARRRLGLPAGRWILFLGRLEPEKRPIELLEIAARRSDWNLIVAGSGSLEAELRGRVTADRRLAKRVRWVGFVEARRKWECLAAADVLALPSRSEGQPLVILESLAAGRPVATTENWFPTDLRGGISVSRDLEAGIDAAFALGRPARALATRVRRMHNWDRVAAALLDMAPAR